MAELLLCFFWWWCTAEMTAQEVTECAKRDKKADENGSQSHGLQFYSLIIT